MRILCVMLLAVGLAACGNEGGECPNPPECTKGKLCGCACIERSKECTKAIEEGSPLGDRE